MKFEIHLDVMQVFVIIAFACLRSKWEKVPEGRMRASSLPSMLRRSRASASLEASDDVKHPFEALASPMHVRVRDILGGDGRKQRIVG